MCYRDGLDYDSFEYLELCFNYKLQTLESRRKINDLCNLNKVCNNHFNSPYIVSQVLLNVPIARNRQVRRDRLFSAESRIKLRKHMFIPRTLSLANSFYDVDIFEPNKEKFKQHIVSLF